MGASSLKCFHRLAGVHIFLANTGDRGNRKPDQMMYFGARVMFDEKVDEDVGRVE